VTPVFESCRGHLGADLAHFRQAYSRAGDRSKERAQQSSGKKLKWRDEHVEMERWNCSLGLFLSLHPIRHNDSEFAHLTRDFVLAMPKMYNQQMILQLFLNQPNTM
jgi:hypothetical protein